MKDYSNEDLLASLNVKPDCTCVQPTAINPNHFDQDLLASLNVSPACLKPTDVVKITPVLIDGDVFYHAQLANGSLIVTSQENAAISLDTTNLPTIPSNPYEQWPLEGPSQTRLGNGSNFLDYVYLAVTLRASVGTQIYRIVGSSPSGDNPLYKGYGPMQIFRPDFTLVQFGETYEPTAENAGDLLCYIGLPISSNNYVEGSTVSRRDFWGLLPDNPLLSRGIAGQWYHSVSSGVSSSELNIMAIGLGTLITPNSPATTFSKIQQAIQEHFGEAVTTATGYGKQFDYSKPGPNYQYNDYKIGVYQLQQTFRSSPANTTQFNFALISWSEYSFDQYRYDVANNPGNTKIPGVLVSSPHEYVYKTDSLWAAATPGSQSRVTDNSQYNSQTF